MDQGTEVQRVGKDLGVFSLGLVYYWSHGSPIVFSPGAYRHAHA